MLGCSRYYLYVASDGLRYYMGYSHDPSLDFRILSSQGYHQLFLLTKGLVIGKALPLLERIAKAGEREGSAFIESSLDKLLATKEKSLRASARTLGLSTDIVEVQEVKDWGNRHIPQPPEIEAVEDLLRGRILFYPEITRLLTSRNFKTKGDIEDILQVLCLEGKCTRLPGIKVLGRGKLICSRCQQEDGIVAIECAACGERCYHCETCLSMGEARSCQSLYAIPGNWGSNRLPEKQVVPEMYVTLSQAQEDASCALRQFVLQPEQREKLVWAACGAGKTEVTFRAIAEALSRSQKVLFAIPRKDIVEEVFVRLRRAFPRFSVACLHGTSKNRFSEADIVVATTHQVMRFYSSFGLIILDEVDAYPFSASPMLQAGILRARAKGGKIIYMTATPSEEMLARQKKGDLACIWIPARHHGYPLPEPRLLAEKKLSLMRGGTTIPESIIDIIHETLEGDLAQLFIFVPSIETGQRVSETLRQVLRLPPFNDFDGSWVEFCHSRDEDREGKLTRFRRGKYPILVTTTICERGLTLHKVNVLVLFADSHRIFDVSALIQMAGRSGRSREYPMGKVWYAGTRCSVEMKKACERIKTMNLQAWNMGYLLPGSNFYLERRGGY